MLLSLFQDLTKLDRVLKFNNGFGIAYLKVRVS